MTHKIFWSNSAVTDLKRVRKFLHNFSKPVANNAVSIIQDATTKLITFPLSGRPIEELEGYYELFIPFASAGYYLRYRVHTQDIYIMHIRHSKELLGGNNNAK